MCLGLRFEETVKTESKGGRVLHIAEFPSVDVKRLELKLPES